MHNHTAPPSAQRRPSVYKLPAHRPPTRHIHRTSFRRQPPRKEGVRDCLAVPGKSPSQAPPNRSSQQSLARERREREGREDGKGVEVSIFLIFHGNNQPFQTTRNKVHFYYFTFWISCHSESIISACGFLYHGIYTKRRKGRDQLEAGKGGIPWEDGQDWEQRAVWMMGVMNTGRKALWVKGGRGGGGRRR